MVRARRGLRCAEIDEARRADVRTRRDVMEVLKRAIGGMRTGGETEKEGVIELLDMLGRVIPAHDCGGAVLTGPVTPLRLPRIDC